MSTDKKTAEVETYETRRKCVRAMRIIIGVTTRTKIREFCPIAKVSVRVGGRIDDEKNIKSVVITHPSGEQWEMDWNGDWIVDLPGVGFKIIGDEEFRDQFVVPNVK